MTFDLVRVHLDAPGADPHRVSGQRRQGEAGLAGAVGEAESRPVAGADEHPAVELTAREACALVGANAGEGVQRHAATHEHEQVCADTDLDDPFVTERCGVENVDPAGADGRRIGWHERNATTADNSGAMPAPR